MNSFLDPLLLEIKQAEEDYLKQKVVQPIHHYGYLSYFDTGNRHAFEEEYFSRRRQLAVLALSVHGELNQKNLQLLSDVIWEICNEFTWAVPAHLSNTMESSFKRETPCIDLFAAETAQALSEIKYLLGEKLPAIIRMRINQEIERRVFQPFLTQTWFWETSANNWSAVVAGSIGMTALYQLTRGSNYQQAILDKTKVCMEQYLDSFAEDGACLEGVGYWAYGFGYYIYFAELYERILGNSYFLELPKVKIIASFPNQVMLTKTQFALFSDYTETALPTGLLTFCRERFGVEIPPIVKPNHLDDDHCYRFAHLIRDLLWAKEYNNGQPSNGIIYLKDAQWLLAHDHDSKMFFAAKGGSNAESHNHNDVGHLIVGIDQVVFLTDLGAGEYVRSYFQNERYDFLVTSSKGHSLPVVNGSYQHAGNYHAKNVKYEDHHFQMDLSEVYPEKAELEALAREYTFMDSKKELLLIDTFMFKGQENRVVESFVTLYPPKVFGNCVMIKAENYQCQLEFETNHLEVESVVYRTHQAKDQIAYLIQATYEFPQTAKIEINIKLDKQIERK